MIEKEAFWIESKGKSLECLEGFQGCEARLPERQEGGALACDALVEQRFEIQRLRTSSQ